MANCPNCNTEINENYNFCTKCELQVKCINCGEILVPKKTKCLKCGKSLIDEVSQSFNEISLKESYSRSASSRTVEGKFSDIAIGQVASLLSNAYSNMPRFNQQSKKISDGQLPLLPTTNTFQVNESTPGASGIQYVPLEHSPEESSKEMQLKKYFTKDGDGTLIARTIDFKGKNKKEQQIRFILMYVVAHKTILGALPNQEQIFNALKNSKIFDINIKTTYFNIVVTQFLTKGSTGFDTKLSGDNEIEKILQEMNNPEKIGYTAWGKTGKPRSRTVSDSKSKENIKTWIDTPFDVGDFDIKSLTKPTQYSMFSLFILAKKLNAGKAFTPSEIFEFLKGKYGSISCTKDSLRKSLIRKHNVDRFEKTSEGSFYLSLHGEGEVEKWLTNGKVNTSEITDEDNKE